MFLIGREFRDCYKDVVARVEVKGLRTSDLKMCYLNDGQC